jgi:hypothetical protein
MPSRAPAVEFRRRFDAAAPMRVAFVGDSVAFSVIPSLQATADEMRRRFGVPVVTAGGFAGPGFGLTADVAGHNDVGPTAPPEAYRGWRDAIHRMVHVEDPDVVLVLLGLWDMLERHPDGRVLRPGMPAWQRWYGGLADEFVRSVTARGATVVWLTMPCVGRRDLNERLAHVNAVLHRTRRLAPQRVVSVPLSRVACENGRPVYEVPGPWGPLTVREADGIHFRPDQAVPVLRPFLVRRFMTMLRDAGALDPHDPHDPLDSPTATPTSGP